MWAGNSLQCLDLTVLEQYTYQRKEQSNKMVGQNERKLTCLRPLRLTFQGTTFQMEQSKTSEDI